MDAIGVVVSCDVRASRELEDRSAFARRLDEVLGAINEAEDLLGAFERQAGLDEFAGVLEPGHVGSVMVRLWSELHPTAIRYAVVQGPLDVVSRTSGSPPAGASQFDGRAFHAASQELEAMSTGRELVRVRIGSGGRTDRLLTALADLTYGDVLDWTERQMEVATAYRRAGSQGAAAEELGVEQSTVSRSLSAASFYRIEGALRTWVEAADAWSLESARAA